MRTIIQRVKEAKVEVENEIVGRIENGLVILVGFTDGDGINEITNMINKIINMRIFDDNDGKMNLSLSDINGSILSISQFTLYADTTRGRRPDFMKALNYNEAQKLYNDFNDIILQNNIKLEKGIFGSHMKVSLVNDGPVTIILDSRE